MGTEFPVRPNSEFLRKALAHLEKLCKSLEYEKSRTYFSWVRATTYSEQIALARKAIVAIRTLLVSHPEPSDEQTRDVVKTYLEENKKISFDDDRYKMSMATILNYERYKQYKESDLAIKMDNDFLVLVIARLGSILNDMYLEKQKHSVWGQSIALLSQIAFLEKITKELSVLITTNPSEDEIRVHLKRFRLENKTLSWNCDHNQLNINEALKFYKRKGHQPLPHFRKVQFGDHTVYFFGSHHKGYVENNLITKEIAAAFNGANYFLIEEVPLEFDYIDGFVNPFQSYLDKIATSSDEECVKEYRGYLIEQEYNKKMKLNLSKDFTEDEMMETYFTKAAETQGKKVFRIDESALVLAATRKFYQQYADAGKVTEEDIKRESLNFKYYSQRRAKGVYQVDSAAHQTRKKAVAQLEATGNRDIAMVEKIMALLIYFIPTTATSFTVLGYGHLDLVIGLLEAKANKLGMEFSQEIIFDTAPEQRIHLGQLLKPT